MAQQRRRSEHEMMRRLAKQHRYDQVKTCRAFANAERAGLMISERKPEEHTPEEYAAHVWHDGEVSGWLRAAQE